MTEWTPGPWYVEAPGDAVSSHADDLTRRGIVCVAPDEEKDFADLTDWPANARLIAKAPEMAALLDELSSPLVTGDSIIHNLQSRARALLRELEERHDDEA